MTKSVEPACGFTAIPVGVPDAHFESGKSIHVHVSFGAVIGVVSKPESTPPSSVVLASVGAASLALDVESDDELHAKRLALAAMQTTAVLPRNRKLERLRKVNTERPQMVGLTVRQGDGPRADQLERCPIT